MASHKPLPDLPALKEPISNGNAPTLSTEYSSHRSRLLHHAFEEVEEKGISGNKEGWIRAFEEALDELSVCLSSGKWFGCIRRAREARRAAIKTKSEMVDDGGDDAPKAFPEAPRPLEDIQRLISNLPTTISPTTAGHLLLCVAPSTPVPAEDSGFALIPSDIACSFSPGVFLVDGEGVNIMFGLNEVKDSAQLLGGTFTFKGLSSPGQHKELSRLLRFAVYAQLSMVLEQHFLKDSHVQLKIPRPRAIKPSISQPAVAREQGRAKGVGFSLSNWWSKKRTPDLHRGNSIDLGSLSDLSPAAAGIIKLGRRFSIMGDYRQAPPVSPARTPEVPFSTALKLLKANKGYLSTSAGVTFDPPLLLDHLAEKEKENSKRKLKGDEKVGLRALLGWEGRENHGKGMGGLSGFVRQQEISVLVSQHVPTIPAVQETPGEPLPPETAPPMPTPKLCGKPRWKTYCYFSAKDDESFGEAIIGLISDGSLPCEEMSCGYPRGRHQLRLVHAGVRINVRIDNSGEDESVKDIQSWESCAECGAKTPQSHISDASWLLSFAKFLELLIYSPTLCQIQPPICEHTIDFTSRFNVQRHFMTAKGSVVFSTAPVDDVFELRVPRIQIRNGTEEHTKVATEATEDSKYVDDDVEGEKKALRREIKQWWEGVSDHVDKLEETLLADVDVPAPQKAVKALPRLPSSDDAYESFDNASPSVFSGQTGFSAFSALTSTTTSSQATIHPTPAVGADIGYFPPRDSDAPTPTETKAEDEDISDPTTSVVPPSVPSKDGSLEKLAGLRHCLQRLEQNLYIQLAQTPCSKLNEVRRTFLGVARGTRKRLMAWKKKHLGSKIALVGELEATEPQWWTKGCHAVPGTNIIVREHDWGSIIAFTLSSDDYHKELANIVFRRTTAPTSPASPAPSVPSSFFSVASGYRFFTSQLEMQPDPDQDDIAWTDMEQFSAVAMRKEHVRDPTSILSIRDVLRKGSVPVFEQAAATAQLQGLGKDVLATRAKPDVQVSMDEADGKVSGEENLETVEKLLHDLENKSDSPADGEAPPPSKPPSVVLPKPSSIASVQAQTTAGKSAGSSVVSLSGGSDVTIGKAGANGTQATPDNASSVSTKSTVPPLPPKDPPKLPAKDVPRPPSTPVTGVENVTSTTSTFATSIASQLFRFVMNSPEVPSSPVLQTPKHHGLLHRTDVENIDDRPHIKYDWTVGKRLKFSCTVFYAKQFDSLRRRCGIEDVFVKSLSKSANWAAEGGKSKSNFWKTSDDRFIIKTLVNAWNVADLQFLIDLAPSYFRYMESTTNKATVLAKLLGFYTIEIRNLETGAVQSKVDLLVMENLFYDQNISKTFDLKGIQGRKVKPSSQIGPGTTKTLFDNEWIEGQQKTPMLVRPHSKKVLEEAIRSDAEFLAKSNIMDYSLLLGVDEAKKEIACGLVDTIGSYTFAKTIEYKAKHGLQSGNKEVTVLPPSDYQERFVRALEGYFVACPDKWSKPLDESKIMSDVDQLPSVL